MAEAGPARLDAHQHLRVAEGPIGGNGRSDCGRGRGRRRRSPAGLRARSRRGGGRRRATARAARRSPSLRAAAQHDARQRRHPGRVRVQRGHEQQLVAARGAPLLAAADRDLLEGLEAVGDEGGAEHREALAARARRGRRGTRRCRGGSRACGRGATGRPSTSAPASRPRAAASARAGGGALRAVAAAEGGARRVAAVRAREAVAAGRIALADLALGKPVVGEQHVVGAGRSRGAPAPPRPRRRRSRARRRRAAANSRAGTSQPSAASSRCARSAEPVLDAAYCGKSGSTRMRSAPAARSSREGAGERTARRSACRARRRRPGRARARAPPASARLCTRSGEPSGVQILRYAAAEARGRRGRMASSSSRRRGQRRDVEHARVAEELAQVAAHRPGLRRLGRPELDEQHAGRRGLTPPSAAGLRARRRARGSRAGRRGRRAARRSRQAALQDEQRAADRQQPERRRGRWCVRRSACMRLGYTYFSGTKTAAARPTHDERPHQPARRRAPRGRGDDVPVGRKADEEVVLGLRVGLGEPVGARQHGRRGEAPVEEAPRRDQEHGGHDHVVQVVDDVVEAPPVDPGQHLGHPRGAREGPVDRVDHQRDEHQQARGAQVAGAGGEERGDAHHAAARREGVDAPRERDAVRGTALCSGRAHQGAKAYQSRYIPQGSPGGGRNRDEPAWPSRFAGTRSLALRARERDGRGAPPGAGQLPHHARRRPSSTGRASTRCSSTRS